MAHYDYRQARTTTAAFACAFVAYCLAVSAPVLAAAATPAASDVFSQGDSPESVAELQLMQTQIGRLVKQLIPTTVAIQVRNAHGSGVIISPDGYILTAAHVAGSPGLSANVRLHDGRLVRGKTLGVFRTVDAGLVKITVDPEEGGWPSASMGNSRNLRPGDWCLATGHPGGFQKGRKPILRVGRVLEKEIDTVQTDCLLIGGDSGGPLFDATGQVVGIHSRIGKKFTVNLHVPVNEFKVSWDRLAASHAWGELPGSDRLTDPQGDRRRGQPYLGVQGKLDVDNAHIIKIFDGSPAHRAGLLPDDIVVRFNGKSVGRFESLVDLVAECDEGQQVTMVVLRGERRLAIVVEIERKVLR